MEVKGYLLRCLRKLKTGVALVPKLIVVDAGPNNADIKSELDRWLENHPALREVKVVLPPRRTWLGHACLQAAACLKKVFWSNEWRRDQAEGWAQKFFPASQQEAARRVAQMLTAHFGARLETLTPATELKDLMANNLEPVKFVLELEREFELEISDTEGESLATVGDVVSCVHVRKP